MAISWQYLLPLPKEKQYHRERMRLSVFFSLWVSGLFVATALILLSLCRTPQWYRETLNSAEQSFFDACKHFNQICPKPFDYLSESSKTDNKILNYTLAWTVSDMPGYAFAEVAKDHVPTSAAMALRKEQVLFDSVLSGNSYQSKSASISTWISVNGTQHEQYLSGRVVHPMAAPYDVWSLEWIAAPLVLDNHRQPAVCFHTSQCAVPAKQPQDEKSPQPAVGFLECPLGSTFHPADGVDPTAHVAAGSVGGSCVGPAVLAEVRLAADLCEGSIVFDINELEARQPGYAYGWRSQGTLHSHVQLAYRLVPAEEWKTLRSGGAIQVLVSIWDMRDPRIRVSEFGHVPLGVIPTVGKSGKVAMKAHFGLPEDKAWLSLKKQDAYKATLRKVMISMFILSLCAGVSVFLLVL